MTGARRRLSTTGRARRGARALGLAAAIAAGVLASGSAAARADRQDGTTLTGCLRTGSSTSVFILRGATTPAAQAPDAAGQMPRDYLLVSVPDSISLPAFVNKTVAVTGVVSSGADAPPPPAGANTAERALRRLSVQAVREVAPDCGDPTR